MPFLTKWGGIYEGLPYHSGRKFWVSPSATYTLDGRTYSSSDNNDGLSPERALATIAQAITNANDAADDMIILLPGAHTATGALAVSKSRLTFWGLPQGSGNWIRPRASVTQATASTSICTVSAADVEFANIRFIPITAADAIRYTVGASRLYVHDCSFDMATPAASTATIGIGHGGTAYTVAPVQMLIQHNYFEVNGAQGPAITLGDSQDFIVERNVFALKSGTWAQVTLQGGVLGWGCYRDNDMLMFKNASITAGITGTDLTSTLSVAILRNFFGGGVTQNAKAIEDWGTTDAYIAENYMTSTGGGGGGVLHTAIT